MHLNIIACAAASLNSSFQTALAKWFEVSRNCPCLTIVLVPCLTTARDSGHFWLAAKRCVLLVKITGCYANVVLWASFEPAFRLPLNKSERYTEVHSYYANFNGLAVKTQRSQSPSRLLFKNMFRKRNVEI